MISRLARRYARALLSLARETESIEQAGNELETIEWAFRDERLEALLASPLVDARKRLEIVKSVVGLFSVSPDVAHLVYLLAERNRLAILPDVGRSYAGMVDVALGRTRARIVAASPLGPAQEQELRELTRRLAGSREVAITTTVDPDLVGGVMLDLGGTVYDGTVSTQLARLSKSMTSGGA